MDNENKTPAAGRDPQDLASAISQEEAALRAALAKAKAEEAARREALEKAQSEEEELKRALEEAAQRRAAQEAAAKKAAQEAAAAAQADDDYLSEEEVEQYYKKHHNSGLYEEAARPHPKRRALGRVIGIVHLLLSIVAVALLAFADVLPLPLLGAVAGGLVALWGICVLLRAGRHKRVRYWIGVALSILLCVVLVFSSLMLFRLHATLRTITGVDSQVATFGVYVLDYDTAQSIEDVKDEPFGVLEAQSRAMTDDTIDQINAELDTTIQTVDYEDVSGLADALLQGACRSIIINESFMDVITETEGYENFASQTRELTSYHSTSQVQPEVTSLDHNADIITLYITGIDTYGNVSTTSRSDVNIIAVANTKTKQVLLVSTPRDYYVPLSISKGIPDKLTHAGIYGVNVSMDTLAMLYDIDMDYYFRINFSGFQEVIDALGGVTVWSDYDFTPRHNTKMHFTKGYNTLNGEQALGFARERYSFQEGDRQRGRNQMAVIQGVIQKLQTPAILNNYTDLLKGLEGSFETNVPSTKITGLVKQQLSDPSPWNVVQYSVDGTGAMNTTYSMNQRLYVMIPDQSTVEKAKQLVEQVENGEVISAQ